MHDSLPLQNPKSKIQNQNLRILLWDIDGTLMHSTVQGGYKKYFTATMRQVYGSAGNLEGITASGMTDTQIMYEALREEGFTPEQIFAKKTNLLETFRREMTSVLKADGEPYAILDGAREILAETAKSAEFVNALLTGNLSVAAELKLTSVGLWHFFADAPNAFGEISHNRADLALEAGKLFNEKYDHNFLPEQFIVIGDTPNDIACARAFGAKALAVATGRGIARETLAEHKPDFLLEDLRDTRKVLEILYSL